MPNFGKCVMRPRSFSSPGRISYLSAMQNRRKNRKAKRLTRPDDVTGQSHLFQGAVVRLFAFQRSARTRSHHEVMILTGLGAAPTRSSGRTISVKTEIDPDRNTARQVVKKVKTESLDV